MAVKTFPKESEYKEGALQLLREGHTVEELIKQYKGQVSERSLYRYLKEVQREIAGLPPKESTRPPSLKATVPSASKDSYTPVGTEIPTTPADTKPPKKFLRFIHINIPDDDWGYSSTENLLTISATYNRAKREFKLPDNMKVGDFTAEVFRAFRLMLGWDTVTMESQLKEIEEVKSL